MTLSVRGRLLFSALVAAMVAALAATLLPIITTTSPASAHGNVVGPSSRNHSCWARWGDRFQDPAMATEDPMCYQAWQADPNAMWNWNGLFREGVAGNHQGAIPDGQLCSAGRTQSGRYNAMDAVGNWKATSLGTSFNLRLYDQASHGADYIWVYVTRAGYNPVTQPLRWADLERVAQIGDTPASQWDPASSGQGVQIDIPVNVPGRSGRAMVYTIWQASHLDQSYYFCSDVNFGGTTQPTTPPATTPPATTPPATTPPTTNPPTGACTATYKQIGQWQGGFQGEVTVTAGSAPIQGWTVTINFANGQQITQYWSANITSSGATATARNVSFNGALGAGASTVFGWLGSWNGANSPPTLTCRAA